MPVKRLAQRKQASRHALATKKPQRGFKAAPPRLRKIIELVNLVRPDDELTPMHYQPPSLPPPYANSAQVEEFNARSAEFRAATERMLDSLTANLPVPFQNYVFQKERSRGGWGWSLPEAARRYETVRLWRDGLWAIARAGQTLMVKIDSALYIARDHAGKKTIIPDALRAALEEDGVDIDYIRECGVCHRIYYEDRLFYKGKLTAPACLVHGQTFRSRRNYKPVKTDQVSEYLTEVSNWKRTEQSVAEIANAIGATTRQVSLALDFIDRKKEAGRKSA
jgi:hypothetical protein